jgi:hypothetical protein
LEKGLLPNVPKTPNNLTNERSKGMTYRCYETWEDITDGRGFTFRFVKKCNALSSLLFLLTRKNARIEKTTEHSEYVLKQCGKITDKWEWKCPLEATCLADYPKERDRIRAEARAEALREAASFAVVIAVNNGWVKTSAQAEQLRVAITQEEV